MSSLIQKLFSKGKRRSERFPAPHLAAFYWDGGAPIKHPVKDISGNGLFLETDERWYPGTLVMMSLQAEDSTDAESERAIPVHARSVRFGEDGVGLAFIFTDPKDPRRGQDLLPAGVDKKTLEKFLKRFATDKNGPAQS
jgi:hypothetical protein